jgi:trk system potassium uptake protein TrkA
MRVIVVGCGRLGADLAYRLYQQKYLVSVIDTSLTSFNNLPPDFQGRTIEGDALSQEVLHRAGIEHADAFAAVTNSDALNAVVAHVARTQFHIDNVVVRNYDPNVRSLHEVFGLQVISATSWGAQRIEELISQTGIKAILSAGNGEVEIYEIQISKSWEGHTLGELVPPEDECLPVSLTRAGRAMLPTRSTRMVECDVIQVSATLPGIQNLRRRFELHQEN